MKRLRTFCFGSLLLGMGTCNINVTESIVPAPPVRDVIYIDGHYSDDHYYYDDDYYYDDIVYIGW